MVRSPFSVRQCRIQTAAVAVASLASALLAKRRWHECGQPESPACKRVKFDLSVFMFNVGLKLMVKIIPPI